MGQGIGVPAGDGVKQQQLQDLVVGQRLQAEVQELPLFPLPVALMWVHPLHPLPGGAGVPWPRSGK